MDQLNQFLITHFPGAGSAKTASAQPVEVVEPNAFDKLAYARVMGELGADEGFLAQFEGTPLAAQAVALAEQELAMEQRHLQARMARDAQMQNDSYMRENNEREGLRLQKMQLCIQLHKMKAMGQGAPPAPGQAVIGEPQPGTSPELGMGADGGAPVQEPIPGPQSDGKLASLIGDAARRGWAQTVKPVKDFARTVPAKVAAVTDDEAQVLPEFLPFGSTYVGYQRGKQTGRGLEGAARGAAGGIGGGIVGSLPGGLLASIAASKGQYGLAGLGNALQAIGGVAGGALGTHHATRGLLPQNAEKQASLKAFAQKLRAGA